MLDSILTLLTSKRSMIALLTAIVDVLIYFGLGIDITIADKLATLITTLGGLLIAGISASDTGKALGKPPGVDHKDRGEADALAPADNGD